MRLSGLAILTVLAACLVSGSSAAPQARVAVGVYANNVPRFDRLTGQHTASALAFIGWDPFLLTFFVPGTLLSIAAALMRREPVPAVA